MTRYNLLDRLPTRSLVTDRLPSDERRATFLFYTKLALVTVVATLGMTMAISGAVLIPMFAIGGAATKVVLSASMLSAGLIFTLASYLWITT